METVVHNIRDLNGAERSVGEKPVGHALREKQQLVIQVLNIDGSIPENAEAGANGPTDVLAWWNIYAGLTDEETPSQCLSSRRSRAG